MTIAVDLGRKVTKQTNNEQHFSSDSFSILGSNCKESRPLFFHDKSAIPLHLGTIIFFVQRNNTVLCLLDLIFNIPVNIFSVMSGWVFLG